MPPPRGRGTAQTAATVESTAAVPRQPASRSSGAHHQTRLRPVDNATDNGLMRTTGERADEPPVVRGKAAGTLTAEELSALRASHDRTVVDVGAGDGRAVYRLARAHPRWLVIGLDPAWRRMVEPGASLDVTVGTDIWREPVPVEIRELPELTLEYVEEVLRPRLAEAGWRVETAELVSGAEPGGSGAHASSWGRRLSDRSRPRTRFMHIRATAR